MSDEPWKFFGHTAITWTNVDISSTVFGGIHFRSISQEVLMNFTRKMLKIILLKLEKLTTSPRGQWVNDMVTIHPLLHNQFQKTGVSGWIWIHCLHSNLVSDTENCYTTSSRHHMFIDKKGTPQLGTLLTLSVLKPEYLWNLINIMAADARAPCVTRSSSTLLLKEQV